MPATDAGSEAVKVPKEAGLDKIAGLALQRGQLAEAAL